MIIIPENYKLIVYVYQFTWVPPTLHWVPLSKRTEQITSFLKEDIENFTGTGKFSRIKTCDELHVLRLLRHVRETVNWIKLQPKNLEFWFDNPINYNTVCIEPTEDGDLAQNVPGGFFTQRSEELF